MTEQELEEELRAARERDTPEAKQATSEHGDFHVRPDFRPGDEGTPEYQEYIQEGLDKIQGFLAAAPPVSGRMPGVRFAPPRSWTEGRAGTKPRVIVVHYTAGSEGPTAAEDGVAYDQRRTDGTSAHFYTDRNSIIQCVNTNDRSHTAKYWGNLIGIHIEQCGTVQTRAQWLDAASLATIRNTAKVCAWVMREHGINQVRLVARQVRTGNGIGGHKDITLGFPEDRGTHMDPDGNLPGSYPYDKLFEFITAELKGEDEMANADQIAADVEELKLLVAQLKLSSAQIWKLLDTGLRGQNETSTGTDGVSRPNNWLVRTLMSLGEEAPPIVLTDAQVEQLKAALPGLSDEDLAKVRDVAEEAAKDALREGTGPSPTPPAL